MDILLPMVIAPLDADASECNPTVGAVPAPVSTGPATSVTAAIPGVTGKSASVSQKRLGRPRKDLNLGKDISRTAAFHALRNIVLDRRADLDGIPATERLFAGRTLASCTNDLERVQVISSLVLPAFPKREAAVPLTKA